MNRSSVCDSAVLQKSDRNTRPDSDHAVRRDHEEEKAPDRKAAHRVGDKLAERHPTAVAGEDIVVVMSVVADTAQRLEIAEAVRAAFRERNDVVWMEYPSFGASVRAAHMATRLAGPVVPLVDGFSARAPVRRILPLVGRGIVPAPVDFWDALAHAFSITV